MRVIILSNKEFRERILNKVDGLNAFCISIIDPTMEKLSDDTETFKTFRFYDTHDQTMDGCFNLEMATELISYIHSHSDKELCFVHCSAGVSRSGAVGEFINDIYGEKWSLFKKRNPRINPNILVKQLLNRVNS